MAAMEDLIGHPALQELAQELTRKQLLGPHSRLPLMNTLWQDLLPALAQQAPLPLAVAEALSNALYHLCLRPAARPEAWLQYVQAGLGSCRQSQEWLDLAEVAAWLSGLPELRTSALKKLTQFPDTLIESLFSGRFSAAELRRGLNHSPWWHPDAPVPETPEAAAPRLRHVFGKFRGWGGPFLFPPQLAGHGGDCFVSSGEEYWLLQADAFGYLLKRCRHLPEPLESAKPWPTREGLWQGHSVLAPDSLPDPVWGLACPQFLALFSPLSFQIYLLASETGTA